MGHGKLSGMRRFSKSSTLPLQLTTDILIPQWLTAITGHHLDQECCSNWQEDNFILLGQSPRPCQYCCQSIIWPEQTFSSQARSQSGTLTPAGPVWPTVKMGWRYKVTLHLIFLWRSNKYISHSHQAILAELDTSYLDLILLHSPPDTEEERREAWTCLENFYHNGKAKAIGKT